jgi:hypothetical protein
MRRPIEVIERHTGRRPRGNRSPALQFVDPHRRPPGRERLHLRQLADGRRCFLSAQHTQGRAGGAAGELSDRRLAALRPFDRSQLHVRVSTSMCLSILRRGLAI